MTEKPDVRELEDNELTIVAGGWASLYMRSQTMQATLLKQNDNTRKQIVQKMG